MKVDRLIVDLLFPCKCLHRIYDQDCSRTSRT